MLLHTEWSGAKCVRWVQLSFVVLTLYVECVHAATSLLSDGTPVLARLRRCMLHQLLPDTEKAAHQCFSY